MCLKWEARFPSLVIPIDMTTMAHPGKEFQHCWNSTKYASVSTLIFGLIISLVVSLSSGLTVGPVVGSLYWLISIPILLSGGLFLGLLGGSASIRHFALRLMLYRIGHIPWNYARFLDYAADRLFLQKVGGGYIFVHRMLLEHFAQMEYPSQGQ